MFFSTSLIWFFYLLIEINKLCIIYEYYLIKLSRVLMPMLICLFIFGNNLLIYLFIDINKLCIIYEYFFVKLSRVLHMLKSSYAYY